MSSSGQQPPEGARGGPARCGPFISVAGVWLGAWYVVRAQHWRCRRHACFTDSGWKEPEVRSYFISLIWHLIGLNLALIKTRVEEGPFPAALPASVPGQGGGLKTGTQFLMSPFPPTLCKTRFFSASDLASMSSLKSSPTALAKIDRFPSLPALR